MRFTNCYDFLSNFYPIHIVYEGLDFTTSEQAYQWAKVRNPIILEAKTPGEAKKYGKEFKMVEGWDQKKISVMREILEQKFVKGSFLALKLILVTEEIVEHNYWHDNFWGVCNCKTCDNKGENMLGKLLTDIRKTLLKGEEDVCTD